MALSEADQKKLAERKEINLKRRSKPTKAEIEAKKKGNRGKIGRPKGDASIINEYKARMLASPKSRKVLDAIFRAALDDDHKHQAAAWKLVMDRVLPTAAFENEVSKGAGKSQIQINITGVGQVDVGSSTDHGQGPHQPIEAEFEDV